MENPKNRGNDPKAASQIPAWNNSKKLVEAMKNDPMLNQVQKWTKITQKKEDDEPIVESVQMQKKEKKKNEQPTKAPPTIKKSKIPLELKDFLPEEKKKKKKSVHPLDAMIQAATPIPPTVELSKDNSKKMKIVENPNLGAAERFLIRRGKERETPKEKKPTKVKKIILQERKDRYIQAMEEQFGSKIIVKEQQSDNNIESVDERSLDIQESAQQNAVLIQLPAKIPKIPNKHSPYREYCTQTLDPELDKAVIELLEKLCGFYERLKSTNPQKARAKKRFISGLREVGRAAHRKKLKCIIMAPNIDEVYSPGGLHDLTEDILVTCEKQKIPVVFALRRSVLGKAIGKNIRICVVGILDYDGANEVYNTMIKLAKDGKKRWKEMEKKNQPKIKIEIENKIQECIPHSEDQHNKTDNLSELGKDSNKQSKQEEIFPKEESKTIQFSENEDPKGPNEPVNTIIS